MSLPSQTHALQMIYQPYALRYELGILEGEETIYIAEARGGEGGDSHMKVTGMLVVSLRVVNCRFWSHFGY